MKPIIAAAWLAICLSVLIASPLAWASDPQPRNWNGTWVGNWTNGDGVQIIFAGNDLIGFYWRGDYLSDTSATLSPTGIVTIIWPSGSATLTRDGETTAHIGIHAGKADESFALKRDS